jgi:outer membrane receptor protein involved in Fe transport
MTFGSNRRVKSMLLAACAAIAIVPASASAQTSGSQVSFNIPAQDLGTALTELARQSHREIFFSADLTRAKRAPRLSGKMTFERALGRLLDGSGLRYRVNQSGSVIIENSPQTEKGGEVTAPSRVVTAAPAEDPPAPEIVVTGTNIRGRKPVGVATIVINRDQIAQTGLTTTESLLESLPQNFSGVSQDGFYSSEGGSRLATTNTDRLSGIDLRGLGADSTLTLMNGNRRAAGSSGRIVDISAIPLSAIERVEIVTGGRSAIYGADAVGGVVNFVTRRDFDGIAAQSSYGFADKGGERTQANVVGGVSGTRGGFVIAYDYRQDNPINLVRRGLIDTPTVFGTTPVELDSSAWSRRHSVFAAGHFELADWLTVEGDGLYTSTDLTAVGQNIFSGSTEVSTSVVKRPNEQFSGSIGASLRLPGTPWSLNLKAVQNEYRSRGSTVAHFDFGSFTFDSNFQDRSISRLRSYSVILNGELPSILGVAPRVALGGEVRSEEINFETNGVASPRRERNVEALFGEISLPLSSDGPLGLRELELSAAARYDHYEDIGGTISPQFGVDWSPADGVNFRASFAKSFRAPALVDLGSALGLSFSLRPDPTRGGALAPVLQINGQDPATGPEHARTWTAGLDLRPSGARWASLSLTYFDIRYADRIDIPALGQSDQDLSLVRSDRFGGLINRLPSASYVSSLLAQNSSGLINDNTGTLADPTGATLLTQYPGIIVFDNRSTNIAVEKVNGIDAGLTLSPRLGDGLLHFSANATYTFRHTRALTATSPFFSAINEVGKPVDLRIRGQVGYSIGPVSAFMFANYIPGYADPFTYATGVPGRIASWTTFDLSLGFDGAKLAPAEGFFRHLTFALSISNLFDAAPPRFRNSFNGIRFDTANADGTGRFVTFRVGARF